MSKRNEIRLGTFTFRVTTRDLRDGNGIRVDLRNKSSEVLAYLSERPNEVVLKADIMEAVWPGVTVTDESLTQCIADIRRAIEDRDQRLLKTHVGRGYSLEIERRPSRNRSGLAAMFAVVLVGVALALGGWLLIRPEQMPPSKPRIAILAFDDLSAEPDKGWLSDGIAEGVITELASYREFLVIARNSSFSFRDSPTEVTEIAQKLNADYIVEGSKQKSGDEIRVTVQLLDGRDGTHIWAQEFDAKTAELFDVQSQIVRSISTSIGRQLVWKEPRTGGADAVDALGLFIQANVEFYKNTDAGFARAIELYQASIEADPSQPFGYTGMALVMWSETSNPRYFLDLTKEEVLKRGFEFANRAIKADREYYRSHIALGDIHNASGDHRRALESYQKAAELNPANAESMVLAAESLLYLDRADEAIELIDQAIEVNPLVPDWYRNTLARAYWWSDRCEEGANTIRMVSNMRPWHLRALIMNLVCLDHIDEARDAGKSLLAQRPNFTVSGHEQRVNGIMPPAYLDRWLHSLRVAGLPEM